MATEGSRTAAGLAAFGLLAAGITTVALVAGSSTPAAAADLARFSSCAELQAWSTDVAAPDVAAEETFTAVDGAMARDVASGEGAGGAATAAPTAAAADDADTGGTGGTNTVVEGVDEIDVVDRLPGDRALVSRNGTLSVVDLTGPTVLSHVGGIPFDGRIAVDGDVVWAAGTASDGSGVAVQRLRLAGDELTVEGEWRSPGFLIDARRSGDTLYVVAVDQPHAVGAIPFQGGPVPCDEVWHPEAGADTPAATQLVGLPATGEGAPTGAAQVVGSGSGFLVTGDAAYVTTQSWAEEVVTGIHRFDLATLQPTGSGSVPGTVPGPFGLNEHEGHLRVATSAQSGGFIGIPVEDDAAVRAAPAPSFGGPLAEVFVLDLDGNLDVVGRTGRFGHDGETIHGVRFVGDTAYVVTFLQTDPFWVVNLADPTAPQVVGELQIPGFSGYLHPIGDGHVVGFGPDGSGRVSARLFDVSDPRAPTVVDELALGDDTPVAWDHHAFVSLGNVRFAVPVTTYPQYVECLADPCRAAPQVAGSTGALVLDVQGDDLVVVDQATVATDGSIAAERILPTEAGGWVLLSWDRLVAVDGGEVLLPTS